MHQGLHNSPLPCTSGNQASATADKLIWFLWICEALIRPVWCEEAPPVANFDTALGILGMMTSGANHSRRIQIPSGRALQDATGSNFFVVTNTLLSDVLSKGGNAVAGVTQRPMSVAFTVTSTTKSNAALDKQDKYIRKELLPALGSLLARSIRVRLDLYLGEGHQYVHRTMCHPVQQRSDLPRGLCLLFFTCDQHYFLNIPISAGLLPCTRSIVSMRTGCCSCCEALSRCSLWVQRKR